MMEARCIKVKLKPGSLEAVRNWFQTLNERKNEVLETLHNEGIFVESAFLDHVNGDDYLIYYIKAENINEALRIFQNSQLPIDVYFKENWKKFCYPSIELKPLLDVDLI